MKRGDVVLVRFPHSSGARGKRRPGVVVQADSYAGVVRTVVVAQVTTNLSLRSDPACLFIDINTPEGKDTGLAFDSVVTGLFLWTAEVATAGPPLGFFSPALMRQLDACLKVALGLP
ncbi:MAG: type II toxin-antitoxin system PemK/MazF family toxin [Gemmataceae bacterium]|nr:type II toxin-antitoxin system PemK/MazF family toxin [Gemmataceae bacterium]